MTLRKQFGRFRALSFRRVVSLPGTLFRSVVFFVLFGSAIGSPLFAQSCAMCYDQASQAGAKASRAIDQGILLLLLPTLLFFVGVLVHAVRRAQPTE